MSLLAADTRIHVVYKQTQQSACGRRIEFTRRDDDCVIRTRLASSLPFSSHTRSAGASIGKKKNEGKRGERERIPRLLTYCTMDLARGGGGGTYTWKTCWLGPLYYVPYSLTAHLSFFLFFLFLCTHFHARRLLKSIFLLFFIAGNLLKKGPCDSCSSASV